MTLLQKIFYRTLHEIQHGLNILFLGNIKK